MNWKKDYKTTSAGILLIVGAVVSIIFNIHNLTEVIVMASITAIVSGIGLLFAKDSSNNT